jgi:hypothetical protein
MKRGEKTGLGRMVKPGESLKLKEEEGYVLIILAPICSASFVVKEGISPPEMTPK